MGSKTAHEDFIGQDASVLDDEDPLLGQDASALDDKPAPAAPPHISGAGTVGVNALDSASLGLLPRVSAFNEALQKVGGKAPDTDLSIDLRHPSSIAKNILARNQYSNNYLSKLLHKPGETLEETYNAYDSQLPGYQEGMQRSNEEHPYLSLLGKVLPGILSAPKTLGQAALTSGTQALLGTTRDLGKAVTDPVEQAKVIGEVGLGTGLGVLGMKAPLATGAAMAVLPTVAGDALGMSDAQKKQMTIGGVASSVLGGIGKRTNLSGQKLLKGAEEATEEALIPRRAIVDKVGEKAAKLEAQAERVNERAETAELKFKQAEDPDAARMSAKDKLKAIFERRRDVRGERERAQVEDFANGSKAARDRSAAEQAKRARAEFDESQKTMAGKRKEHEGEVLDLDKRRVEARGEADRGFLDAFKSGEQESARKIAEAIANAKASEISDATPAARALSKLGHESTDIYAAARLLHGMGEGLDPELQAAVKVLLPDYKASAALKAKEFAGGKKAYLDKLTKQFQAEEQAKVAVGEAKPRVPGDQTRIYDMEPNLLDAVPPKNPGALVGENTRIELAKKVGYDQKGDTPEGADKMFKQILAKYGFDPEGIGPGFDGVPPRAPPPEALPVGNGTVSMRNRPKITAQEVAPETVPFPSSDYEQNPKLMARAESARVKEAMAKRAFEDPAAGQKQFDRAALRKRLLEKQVATTGKLKEALAPRTQATRDELLRAKADATPHAVKTSGGKMLKDAALRKGVMGGLKSAWEGGPAMAAVREAYQKPEARAFLFDKLGSRMANSTSLQRAAGAINARDLNGLIALAKDDPELATALNGALGEDGAQLGRAQ